MNNKHQQLNLEQLEDRIMLAGNVSAFVAGNDLFVTGDVQGNSVTINATDTRIIVNGVDDTTVNGRSRGFVAFRDSQSPDDIHVNLIAGNNALGIDGVQVGDDLTVISGSGVDQIALRDMSIADDATFITGFGADVISLRNVQIADDAEIVSGLGNDFLVFENSTISDDARFFTGLGRDTVAMQDSLIGDHADLFLSEGDDLVSLDSTRINDNAFIFLAGGDDVLNVTGSSLLRDKLFLFGGAGNDAGQISSPDNLNGGQSRFSVERNRQNRASIDARLNDSGGAFRRANRAQRIFGDSNGNGGQTEELTLTVDTDANDTIQSSDTLLTADQSFVINGQTEAGANVEVARDADGVFDDGSVVADASGNFTVSVDLQNDGIGNGGNSIVVRSSLGSESILSDPIDVHFAVGTVVRFETTVGPVDVELLDDATPQTVQNFLNYQQRYANSIVQRSDRAADGSDFIIQGGGFELIGNDPERIQRDAPVQSEFDASRSNIRGTLAMALPSGNPNGGTSEWFFNVSDQNSFLDAQQFTVFGRVVGSGMNIVDAIHALPTFNLDGVGDPSALADLPLIGYAEFTGQISGTVSVNESAGDILITGNNTLFSTELAIGQAIRVDGQVFTVRAIFSDTELAATGTLVTPVSSAVVEVNILPDISEYVIVNSIDTLNLL